MNISSNAPIRRPLLSGHQLIAGLWFSAERFDDEQRIRELVSHWQTGARAYRYDDGDLLIFATPAHVDCDHSLGWPLLRVGAALCSAALAKDEIAALPVADLHLVRGAQAQSRQLAQGSKLALHAWMDIDRYGLLDTYDCSQALTPPAADVPPPAQDLREVLGDAVPPPSAERGQFLANMARRRQQASRSDAAAPRGAGRSSRGSFWQTLLQRLAMPVHAAQAAGHARAGHSHSDIAPRAAPVKPQAWRNWLARLANATLLGKMVGRKQAAYLRRMMKMFDEGNLQEALRHAVPLDGDLNSTGQAFDTPGRRDSLSLQEQRAAGPSMMFDPTLNAHLRTLYRQSFEKLDRAGRVDEAVFVLAELLNARQEALDYLEKHGRLEQAARLSLAWDCAPATIVRLHCLVGDWKRAIQIVRRDDAFAQAIPQMQEKWPEAANRLRMEWAEMLCARGDWLEAVEAIWPLPEERERAAQWLCLAERAGGGLSARALVKRAMLLPDTLNPQSDLLRMLFEDPAASHARSEMLQALLLVQAQTPKKSDAQQSAIARLANQLIAPLLEDHGAQRTSLASKDLKTLIAFSGDALLQADLPSKLPSMPARQLSEAEKAKEWFAPDPGAMPLLDAAALDEDRTLLALGESGALVVDRCGRTLFRFAVPADVLVIAKNRRSALTLARRGHLWRIGRLDLATRRATDLGMLAFDFHARDFDGTNWVIATLQEIRVVDVDREFSAHWRVGDLPGSIVAYQRFGAQEHFLIVDHERPAAQMWSYALPSRRLIARNDVADSNSARILAPGGELISVGFERDNTGARCLRLTNASGFSWVPPVSPLDPAQDDQYGLRQEENWLFVGTPRDAHTLRWTLFAYDSSVSVPRAQLDWPADAAMTLRVTGSDLVAIDTQGRLFRCNLKSGEAWGAQVL
ncbi:MULTISPECIES: bpX6 domain-containing protein [Achromobacter]|uniref:bpX6 domain-containing protein n=1 Tax=Achromobacter TaxID=222 RepID=UPI000A6A577A|nr:MULTISPECIES: bpX6 domain-containing protein [Achromobacter]